jgi:tetratricopeptide (TPR) repeat protein
LERQLGPEHRLTLLARRTYANVLVRLEQFDEAEKTLRKVTEALPRVIGVDHADNVETLNSYGYLLFLMNRFDEAEVQYHKAIEISERVFGPEHDNTLRPILNLAFVEKSRGLANAHDADGDGKIDVAPDSDLARAELHFRRAYSGFKKLYGELHSNVAPILFSLGEMLYRVGNYAESARILRQYAEAMLQKKDPGYEEDVTHVLMLQGIASMRAGSLEDGQSALRDCVERCRAVFPEGDWRTAVCASAWGECLTKLGKHSDAEAQLKASVAVLESLRNQRKRDYADVVRRLADLYEAQGQSDRALEWREKL